MKPKYKDIKKFNVAISKTIKWFKLNKKIDYKI